jgi:hypothetical protein
VRLFLEVPYYFDEKICLQIANYAQREDFDIQMTIYEFLEGLGQEHLMVDEQNISHRNYSAC